MIRCLIFDLDDTLYYEKTYVLQGLKNVSKYLSVKYEKDYRIFYNSCTDILEQYGRGQIFNILCNQYNIKENISNLIEVYRNTKPKLKLYKQSLEILEYAKEHDLKTGIITDGCSKVQWSKIKALKLDNIINKIIVTDDYKCAKPSDKAYIKLIKFFHVQPEECVYIGDNPNKDFIGAKKTGMHTVRIIHKYGNHINDKAHKELEAEMIIKNLNEILTVL